MFPHAVKSFSKNAKCLVYCFFYYPFVIGQQMKANYLLWKVFTGLSKIADSIEKYPGNDCQG
jgi:hypothetical protein